MPVPVCGASASAADRRESAIRRSAKSSGRMFFLFWHNQFIAPVSELFFPLKKLKIQEDDLPILIDQHHRTRSCFQQLSVSVDQELTCRCFASRRTLKHRL